MKDVTLSENKRGMTTMSKGRKLRGKDKWFVKLTDNQNRVYETKKAYSLPTIKRYFNKGQYVQFTRNQKTGETIIKRVA